MLREAVAESITVLHPMASHEFIETSEVGDIIHRSLHYIKAGFPIHMRGVAGTGKTTLAFRLAELLGRPVVLIHGDEELSTTNLIGGETGYHVKHVRDNFIASVLKVEEESSRRWVDNRLTVAVENGYTLIYDEFTRSRPEANNVLLSVLQEGLLNFPSIREGGDEIVKVHPDFHAIFTSNPEEYAGVHRSQDALRDRLITIDLSPLGKETELAITKKKSGLSAGDAGQIVDIVRAVRDSGQYEFAPTVRGCIMIAKSVRAYEGKVKVNMHDPLFKQICLDILTSETSRIGSKTTAQKVREVVNRAIRHYCKNGIKRRETHV